MRILEIILVILVGVRLLAGLKWRDRWLDWLVFGTMVVLGLHLGFEGCRWQMLGVYTIVVVMTFLAILRISQGKPLPKPSIPKFFVMTLILAAATTIPILVPIPKSIEPTGPYGIGTMTVMMVDESREELYSAGPPSPRKIMVQIWYPTDPGITGETTPWIDNVEVMAPALAELLELPSFSLSHLKYVHGHAHKDAQLSDNSEQYPVLLFSHGWSGFKAQNTFQVEELVSHGYIIAAPDHAYGAVASVFPDGEVLLVNPDALPNRGSLSEDERLGAVRLLGEQWAGDLSFILDKLLDPGFDEELTIFSGRIDPDSVGAFGHSTGGGAAIEFCGTDHRCDAVLGMDPYMEPVSQDVINMGSPNPLLAMFSETWNNTRDTNQSAFTQLKSNSTGSTIEFHILETAHYDFSDLPGLSPLAHTFGLKGKISGDRVVDLINDYTLAFFEQHLNDIESMLLTETSTQYPEVIWGN